MRPSLRSRGVRGLLMVLATIGLLLVWVTPGERRAGSAPRYPPDRPQHRPDHDGHRSGQGVTGAIGPVGTSSDPSQPYPAAPPSGFTGKDEGFAGIIHAQSVQTQEQLSLFCIDIRTDTYPGIGYENGTWDASNVPNVGYIARILNDYYPNTGEPAAAPNDNVRAAAVQAAIWYFSDNYVLQPNEPVRAYTEAILEAGAHRRATAPTEPAQSRDPPTTDKGPANEPLGPYTVSSDSTDPDLKITVSSTGGTMYSDAAGTTPIANGTAVVNGAKIYLRPDDEKGGGNVTLAARGVATVPSGNVYLYDGNTPGVNDAQRLILAQDAEVSALTSATGTFDALSSLKVTKTIAGSSAGQQGPITVHVACDNGHKQDIEIPANQPAGATSTTIDDLPVGTVCTDHSPTRERIHERGRRDHHDRGQPGHHRR